MQYANATMAERFFFTGEYANGCGLYCERPVNPGREWAQGPCLIHLDGSWIQYLTAVNIVRVQSGDPVQLARGLTRAMPWLRDLCRLDVHCIMGDCQLSVNDCVEHGEYLPLPP